MAVRTVLLALAIAAAVIAFYLAVIDDTPDLADAFGALAVSLGLFEAAHLPVRD